MPGCMADAGPPPGVSRPLQGDGRPPLVPRGAGLRAPGTQAAHDAAARTGSANVLFGLVGVLGDVFWLLPIAIADPAQRVKLVAGSVCLVLAVVGQLCLLASSHRIARGLLADGRGVVLGLLLGVGGAGLWACAGTAAVILEMVLAPLGPEVAPCCLLIPVAGLLALWNGGVLVRHGANLVTRD